MITPNASDIGFPPTETEAPSANERMNVEAIGPEETLPLSNESPTKISGTKKDRIIAIEYTGRMKYQMERE